MDDNRIDLDKQLIDLFNKEEMLAFFDFQLTIKSGERVSGLCKISKSKEKDSNSKYFSLLFVIDTPDDASRKDVKSYVESINWDILQIDLPQVENVFSIPHANIDNRYYFKEVYIIVGRNTEIMKPYVIDRLYPAIKKIEGIECGEIVFWDDSPEKTQFPKEIIISERKSGRSLSEIVKRFFS
jgi:hypothetical protein